MDVTKNQELNVAILRHIYTVLFLRNIDMSLQYYTSYLYNLGKRFIKYTGFGNLDSSEELVGGISTAAEVIRKTLIQSHSRKS